MGDLKKIIITGHTKGIGKEIYNYFVQKNFNVIGFSRSNNFDISIEKNRDLIIEQSKDADIFVNNAYDRIDENFDSQLDLLKRMSLLWANLNKTIINISSLGSNYSSLPEKFVNESKIKYRKNKFLQDRYIKSIFFHTKVNIINLKPMFKPKKGFLNAKYSEISKILDFVLDTNNNFIINSLTTSPKKNYE